MVTFLLIIGRFFRAIFYGLRDPEFRALLAAVALILAGGTLFYARIEGWSLLDAFYFSVITLTTVGYGDLSPTTPISKIFTVIYILLGISILLAFINKLASKANRSVADVTNGEQETESEER